MSEGIQIVGRSDLWYLYLRMFGKFTTKNYRPTGRATLDSNLNHRFVKHHKKCSLFSDFHFGFRYSRSNLDLLAVMSDRTAPVSDRSVTWYITVVLDISKGFDRVWLNGLLQNLVSYGISGWLFLFIFSFLRNSWLWLDLDGKSSWEYLVNTAVPENSILVLTQFLLYINDFPDDALCNITIHAVDTTLYSKCE